LASFVKLFSQSRTGQITGCVTVQLRKGSRTLWDVRQEPDENTFEIVKRAYVNRHVIERQPREKALVTIHGIRTQAEWNSEVTLIASVNGWAVAPFQYGYVDVDVFIDRHQRNEIVDRFRAFAFELKHTFDLENISIIAHSFGTYIIARYLLGFDDPPEYVDELLFDIGAEAFAVDRSVEHARRSELVTA
jgi:pimeloyl-ACP methyl ester carboxylesterase